MTELPPRVRINSDQIASKVIDGEAILINLTTGVYYSMAGSGAEIWSLIEQGCSREEIVEEMTARYDVDRSRCREDIVTLWRTMISEDLIQPDGEGTEETGERSPGASGEQPYRTPELNIYRDMGDLLALDPPVPGLEPIPFDDPERGISSEAT